MLESNNNLFKDYLSEWLFCYTVFLLNLNVSTNQNFPLHLNVSLDLISLLCWANSPKLWHLANTKDFKYAKTPLRPWSSDGHLSRTVGGVALLPGVVVVGGLRRVLPLWMLPL